MSNKSLRNGIRIVHLIDAISLFMYFYSPIAGDETLRQIIQNFVLPSLIVTGTALWQQAYLNKLLKRPTPKSAVASAHPERTD